MAIRFILTDPETGDGYNIDDDTGDVYDADGNLLDSETAEPVGTDDDESEAEYQRLLRYARGESGLGNISPDDDDNSINWMGWANTLGLTKKDGGLDWDSLLGIAGIAANLGNKPNPNDIPHKVKSLDELRAGMGPNNIPADWTDAEKAFGQKAWLPAYADGGEVEGALSQVFEGAVMGDEGGQSDLINIRVSPGEYVMDAESVSALGDGNTEAGVAKLDELRRNLREQKRSTPNDQIPPEALGPLSYLKGA